METLKFINYIIALTFFICYFYQLCYIPASLLIKHKPHKAPVPHRYAVLISARNEERVIAQLIGSIRDQTYPSELITAFVIADNCTDGTAELARSCGAVVYERFNNVLVGKGYALDELLTHIERDYADEPFDAYLVLDADNVLSENYLEEINKTFSDGYEIVTSYRNSKNYGDNWISAGYALWFLRESKYLNNARMALGTSCAVSGTGFVFSRALIERLGGWKFYLLTEDIEFTVHNITEGIRIGYCPTAVLYDEQPTTFMQSWRQRMRWAKGYIQVFRKYGLRLIAGTLRGSFACFDMSMTIMPAFVLTVTGIIVNLTAGVMGALIGDNVMIAVESVCETLKNAYLMVFVIGLISTITEWKQIHASVPRKLLFIFTFPVFMFTYIPISFCAIFKKVQWTPIEHTRAKTLAEIRK